VKLMDNDSITNQNIEQALSFDFSKGQKDATWNKIQARLSLAADMDADAKKDGPGLQPEPAKSKSSGDNQPSSSSSRRL
jgi:hypothetical protein